MIKIVLKKSSQKNLWNSIFAFFLAAFLFCGCSGKSSKTIIRLQKMEENVGSPTTEAELKDRYQEQLRLYTKALEQITRKKVKEQIIYSFTLCKEIHLEDYKND